MLKLLVGGVAMKKIMLIDGNSIMYRAYYALAAMGNFMKNSKGMCTNAIYAFINMMNHIVSDDYEKILVAFDAGKKTFRHEIMEDYKGGRTPMPDEMRMQIPFIKQYLDLVGIKRYEMPLYEADDIIGTMAKLGEKEDYMVEVYSSDKDLLQLITDKTTVFSCKKGLTDLEEFTPSHFMDKYGISPIQMIDLKALMGDASDNIKGIKGVGEKTAIKLIQEYSSVEGIIENRDFLKGKLGEVIRENYNDAIVCKEMVTINVSSPIEIGLDDINRKEVSDDLLSFFKELEFNSFLKKMPRKQEKIIYDNDFDLAFVGNSYIYMEMINENYHEGQIVGFSIVNDNGNFYFDKEIINNKKFIVFMESESIMKKTYAFKKMKVALKYHNIEIKGFVFDLLLASYLINPKSTKGDFSIVSSFYGYDKVLSDEEIYGKGVKLGLPEKDKYVTHILNKALAIKELYPIVNKKLMEQGQIDLLEKIELPLANVLGEMEYQGMSIDKEELNKQKESLLGRIYVIEKEIYDVAGETFNISSPKQLGTILFEKLNLPNAKKTKTGYSTDSEVLEALKFYHELPSLVLEYRQLTKLFSTYIDGLDRVSKDDKVHTIFQQTLTETGRLSSIEPNLQNIPIRREDGALIRKIFVPTYDYFVSMDYSQIELRILAHMANVDIMIDDFINNRDIHESTAKKILHKDEVNKRERQSAKAINFGIVYGMSAWGLASELRISSKEAQNFIDEYFEHYPQIKTFMDGVVSFAKENGYVKTIMNRRRYVPEITNPVYAVREAGKRNAMNAPIQGSAADIIKKAMVDVYNKICSLKLSSKLVLQVHDELIFDCPKDEMNIILQIGKEIMENTIKLSVPLLVECGYGKNWYEAK